MALIVVYPPPKKLLSDGIDAEEPMTAEEKKVFDIVDEYLIKCILSILDERDEGKLSLTDLELDSDEDESDDDESDDDEEPGLCEVCLKCNEHWTHECPYLDSVPNPKDTTVGHRYMIVCKECHKPGGHSDRNWEGRAIMDPLALIYLKNDPSPMRITDMKSVQTMLSLQTVD